MIDDFDIADISGDGAKSLADYDYGWTFNLSDSASSYFPAAARFDGSYAMLMGSMSGLWGSYWGNAPYPGDMFRGGAYSVLSFQIKDTAGNEMITTRRRRCPRRRLLGALHPRINLSDAFTTESGAECRLPIPFAGRATCRERTDARSPRRRGICA